MPGLCGLVLQTCDILGGQVGWARDKVTCSIQGRHSRPYELHCCAQDRPAMCIAVGYDWGQAVLLRFCLTEMCTKIIRAEILSEDISEISGSEIPGFKAETQSSRSCAKWMRVPIPKH